MLKSFLRRHTLSPARVTDKPVPPPGYWLPASADELLDTPQRQQWLKMLWDYSSLPKEIYHQYILEPLKQCVALMQQFPSTESEHHSGPGGMVDYLMRTLVTAVRLSKSYMLPVGAEPEEQVAQGTAWAVVVTWAAMFHTLGALIHLEVELEDGHCWTPFHGTPSQAYRFRSRYEKSLERRQSYGAMLACRLLPAEGIAWLSQWPEVIRTLATSINGSLRQSGVVGVIVNEALRQSLSCTDRDVLTDPVAAPESISTPTILPAREVVIDNNYDDEESEAPMASETPLSQFQKKTLAYPVGIRFFNWLREGLGQGKIGVNSSDSYVHLIAGVVFLKTPSIFHQFMAENKDALLALEIKNWREVQKQFEKLGLHRRQRNGVNMYRCRIRKPLNGDSSHLNGYLVPAHEFYGVLPVPADTSLLEI